MNPIELAQTFMKEKGHYLGSIDGDIGPGTRAAFESVMDLPPEWNNQRKVWGVIQLECEFNGIYVGQVDGYPGAQTEYALEMLLSIRDIGNLPAMWRDDEVDLSSTTEGMIFPKATEAQMNEFYGEPGSNHGKVTLPYPLKIAWIPEKTIRKFTCHELLVPSIGKALTQVKEAYGLDEIKRLKLDYWGGCFNIRKKRGGSTLSTHSWAAAIDFDPENNKLRWGSDKASFAHSDYNDWWEAWEDAGWVSLGRQKGYDYMHLQAANI